MKYICFAIVISVIFACNGSKKVIQNKPENKVVLSDTTTTAISTVDKRNETVSYAEKKVEEPSVVKKTIEEGKAYVEAFNHQPWTILLQKHVSDLGKVDYQGFIKDRIDLRNYLNDLSSTKPLESWSRYDQLAYWLNVYNAFTIKLIIDNYPLKSIKNIKKPWDFRFIKIEKKWYTLNDIEHRILRKMNDPRIHFGINCASFSCPSLLNEAFTAQKVDQQLEELTINFVNDQEQNTITVNSLQLSMIFNWFASDFKKKGSLIDFLNKYAKTKIHSKAKKNFKKYDWRLNE